MTGKADLPLGATPSASGSCSFLVWAPKAKKAEVHIVGPQERWIPMEPMDRGYFAAPVSDAKAGDLYFYRLDGQTERPDPASRFQPQGVHSPSQIVEPRFKWSDHEWRGIELSRYVIYELHVGTFTGEGTFQAAIPRIRELKELGITAIEIMPVAQFPGKRNWGYDGVYPFAVQDSYGGPAELKRFVNACHGEGMAVVLDVVYNHMGPEGNYLADFGPYFTDYYHTPWGAAINFEQAQSDEVRRYFVDNALQWITEFHVDGLRLDAIHAIIDPSARSFVQKLAAACHAAATQVGRKVQIIAESNRNDRKVVSPCDTGGWGLDAEWNDDFHHSLRALLTGERDGYYQDFGDINDLAQAFREGFVYAGRYSKYRQKHYGNSSRELPGEKLVIFSQNHDQVGNRREGDRLLATAGLDRAKLAAAAVLLAPYVPLLFMGEEYGETAPFLYFVSHGDPALIEAVRKGRTEEFASFGWSGEVPDPQSEETFERSRLNWSLQSNGDHATLREFYRELLRLRTERPALAQLNKNSQEISVLGDRNVLFLRRWHEGDEIIAVFNFAAKSTEIAVTVPDGRWNKILDSHLQTLQNPGLIVAHGKVRLALAPWSVCVLSNDSK